MRHSVAPFSFGKALVDDILDSVILAGFIGKGRVNLTISRAS
jgi:hypothetical protein